MKRVKVGDLVEWIDDGDIGIVIQVKGKTFCVKWPGFEKSEWYKSAKRIRNLRVIA